MVAGEQLSEQGVLRQAFVDAGVDVPVYFARHGHEVLDYLHGKPPFEDPLQYPLPTLLLLDVSRPHFGGLEILEWVRQDAHVSHMPVIALVALNQPEDMTRAR